MNDRQWHESRSDKTALYFGEHGSLIEKSLETMSIALQPKARPLTVSTRGVGVIAVVEYRKMCTTWNVEQMRVICTIYQFYRITLLLVYYKVYLGQQVSSEQQSYATGVTIELNDEVRQILSPVSKIPSATSALLGCIGKITTSSGVWHSHIPHLEDDVEDYAWAWSRILFTHPDNIRRTLLDLSDPAVAVDQRQLFHERNVIPGAQWSADHLLENADQIWPAEYGPAEMQADLHAYNDLLTRAGSRLPAHFLSEHEWSGVGNKAGTWSTDCLLDFARLEAQFEQRQELRAVRRNVRGAIIAPAPAEAARMTYIKDEVLGSASIDHWTPDNSCINGTEAAVGAMTKIGHGWNHPTRLKVNGVKSMNINPYSALSAVLDTPRPPANR